MITRSIIASTAKLRKIYQLNWYHSAASIDSSTKPHPFNLLDHKDWLSPNEVVKIFETLKDPNSTLTVLNQLSKRKDYKPNEALYASVIDNLSKAKNFDGIEQVMKLIKLEKGCRLSDGFFYNVIRIYGLGAGRINRAIDTLFDMPSYGCWPTPKTFNFVLNLLVNTKQFDVIHEVFMAAGKLGVEIDACCLNIMIKGLCKNGDVNAALQVFDEFPKQNCKPNVRTFSALIHGLCESGRIEEAFSFLEKMETEGVDPDTILINILISGLRKNGRIQESIELFNRMLLKGCEPIPSSYQEVLYALLDSRKYAEAINLTQKMSSKKMVPSFESYKLMISGLCEENLMSDVNLVLKQMIENGFVPKMAMWRQILQCMLSGYYRSSWHHQDMIPIWCYCPRIRCPFGPSSSPFWVPKLVGFLFLDGEPICWSVVAL
ncbi:pentatricopeptide repeat-containing protein At3g14580, mitochondrial [Cynara cardunculus var. scolymus]|uniref:pentatricopeptide repeat-containing protein At3g14580, mitochondrial n=1 Tax=Cynara cardunculus var. scolymus TaxID=59895 RepID=UPI000D62AA15|nr:pentatricopeptide repeat-containing protein At3g14580, mitochondrial [Cynara cardunculus var. scolymus]